jgi:hypothetical protein
VLALAAIGLGAETRWWLGLGRNLIGWRAELFILNPLPFAGWTLLAFGLGVFFGAVMRQTVPAMAGSAACYAALLFGVAVSWRARYLPPLHRATRQLCCYYNIRWGGGPGPNILSTYLGWPDGRALGTDQQDHSQTWLARHHILLWVTYQPASRYVLFQWIEFGWLTALAALLIAVTLVLVRRRAA